MTTATRPSATLASAAYAALRHGGAPPAIARVQLGLGRSVAFRLEKMFQARRSGGCDAMRPRFARHELHVKQVMKAGGFPILPERRR